MPLQMGLHEHQQCVPHEAEVWEGAGHRGPRQVGVRSSKAASEAGLRRLQHWE